MSYNYEINHNQKRKPDYSKYIYKKDEIDSQIFIFELALKDKFNNIQVIRKIKKGNQGNIMSNEDNIQYDMILKYKLTIIDANNTDNIFIIKNSIDHTLSTNTFFTNDVYLEIIQNSEKYMNFNYHININQ